MSFEPTKDIKFSFKDATGAVKEGVMHLEADMNGAEIQKVINNVLHVDLRVGITMDSINYPEYIVQVAQRIIKTAPEGFDINSPDSIRKLKPSTWGELEDFIGECYPLMTFLQRRLKVIFGNILPEQDSQQPIGST